MGRNGEAWQTSESRGSLAEAHHIVLPRMGTAEPCTEARIGWLSRCDLQQRSPQVHRPEAKARSSLMRMGKTRLSLRSLTIQCKMCVCTSSFGPNARASTLRN